MANIPALPNGQELYDAHSVEQTLSYGEHLQARIHPKGWVALFRTGHSYIVGWFPPGTPRAGAKGPGVLEFAPTVSSSPEKAPLDATIVPYVNKFIAHTGQKVEKYWRTSSYRLVPIKAVPAGSHRPIRRAVPVPVSAITPETEAAGLVTAHVVAATEGEKEAVPEESPEKKVEPLHIRIAPDTRAEVSEGITGVPGLDIPEKAHVKADGKGWLMLGDIVVPEADAETLNDAWALRQTGVPAAVLITGPAGTAKTALARAFAAAKQVPFLKVDGGAVRTADDWAGAFRQDRESKTWEHRWSPFAQVLRRGRPAIVLIDELNRTESPQALNALLGLLDWTGTLLVPDANAVLTLPAGVLVIATANIGPEFVGTLPIDGAVRQRFPYGVRLGYPEHAREAKLVSTLTNVEIAIADRLVKLANLQRVNREDPQLYPSGAVISTRVVIDIARRIAQCGTVPRDAVLSTLRGQFESGDEKALMVAVDTQFPVEKPKPKPVGSQAVSGIVLTHKYVQGWNTTVNRYDCRVRMTDPTTGIATSGRCEKPSSDPVHV